MDSLNLPELHTFACTLAIDAGSYLRDQALARASRSSSSAYDLELTIKENAADLVTKADMHAEAMISDAIRKMYPGHKSVTALRASQPGPDTRCFGRIIGEESYSAGQDKRFLLDDVSTASSRDEAAEASWREVGERAGHFCAGDGCSSQGRTGS
jgi:myo-inositol-1(or 4)-monophosphatase